MPSEKGVRSSRGPVVGAGMPYAFFNEDAETFFY